MLRRLLLGLVAALTLATLAPAQETKPVQGPPDLRQVQGPPAPGKQPARSRPAEAGAPDYEAWSTVATRAEAIVAGGEASSVLLDNLRLQIADWRAAFLAAQGANSARIATLRGQLDALGPVPGEGLTEAAEIAARRTDLTDQLVRIQAPVIAADEAYSRADGLIAEIDRQLRERQADALMRLLPTPLNPANWPDGVAALYRLTGGIGFETWTRATDPSARAVLFDRIPTILALLLAGIVLIARGRTWAERLSMRLAPAAEGRTADLRDLAASFAEIAAPALGLMAIAEALSISGMFGPTGQTVLSWVGSAAVIVFAARWLGLRQYPRGRETGGPLRLPPEARAMGRLASTALGLLVALEALRRLLFDPVTTPETAQAVLAFPGVVLAALALYRLGQLLRRHATAEGSEGEASLFRNRLIGLAGRAAMVAAGGGAVLAAAGYIAAGTGLVYPAALSLGLMGLLFVLQKLVSDLFVVIAGEDRARDALLPVMIGFALSLLALPVLAMIWGARWVDITEMVARAQQGFAIGQTRISPSAFLTFAVLFALGFLLTRLLQGALKSTVLPRTRLDRGGQNAVVAGTGYLGIFLAALIAINAAGIDLSGLAIVAGALSVGIGFGLQQIVSNFISGVILLVERPISEGDWIEVGPVSGVVKAISVRSTRIQTFDRSDVIVPNSDLITRQVTNWTRFSLTGRLVVPVNVVLGSDTRRVEAILREVVAAQPQAVLNPPPLILLTGIAGEVMTFEIRVILRDVYASPEVRSAINHDIARRFAEAGIDITPAQRDFRLRMEAEAAARSAETALPPASETHA